MSTPNHPGRAPNEPNAGPSGAPRWGTPPTLGQRIDEAVELIEMELRHAVTYVNDAVIPQVRRESITAMRTVADTLRNLADRFERQSGPPPSQPYGQAPNQAGNQTSGQPNESNREPRS
ncbi:MAG TPA: hypothetical protein VGG45_20595 [Terracidiphilus sp.]